MKEYIKKLLLVLIILMIGYIAINTYSKYAENATARIEQELAKWSIKINDVDITSVDGSPVEFEIDTFEWQVATHVKEGKVAPGMKGAFEFTVDPTDTDVSIQYSITIDDSKLSESNDINLKIKKIIVDGEEYEYTSEAVGEEGDEGTEIEIAIVKPLSEIKSTDESVRKDNIVIQVEWENNEEFNEKDSELGSVPDNVITLPIKINVIQYTGEETTPEPEPEPDPGP